MSKIFLTVLMLIGYAIMTGCGTAGPLYIPEQRYPQKTQDEAPATPDASPANQTTTE